METVQSFVGKAGGRYDPADPLAELYTLILNQVTSQTSRADLDQAERVSVEASLRVRRLIYWKQTPGDCPSRSNVTQPTALKAGQLAIAAGQTVGALGVSSLWLAGPTAGLSLAIVPFSLLWAHHAQAVATEQATLCEIVGTANPILAEIDQAFVAGRIGAQQALEAVVQLGRDVNGAIEGIRKRCNAACVIGHQMDAQVLLRRALYVERRGISGQQPTTSRGRAVGLGGLAAVGYGAFVA